MKYRFIVTVLLIWSFFGFSQETFWVKGIIQFDGNPVKDIKISNLNTKSLVYSNDKGEFQISVTRKDSLLVSSIFYEDEIFVITNEMRRKGLQIHLKERINELSEVVVEEKYIAPEFNRETYNLRLNEQFKNDFKNDPYKYLPPGSGSLDILKVISLIGGLIFKKEEEDREVKWLTFHDLTALFSEGNYPLNEEFLTRDLSLPKDQINVFFMYCESQKINSELVLEENRFSLIDTLVSCNKEFQKRLQVLGDE